MTGVAGTIHSSNTNLDRVIERLVWTGEEDVTTRTVSDVTVATSFHPQWSEEQPAQTEDGASLWVWDAPRGGHGRTGYEPRDRPPQASPARYCATLYDRFGMSFVRRLNGSAVGVDSLPALLGAVALGGAVYGVVLFAYPPLRHDGLHYVRTTL